MNPRQVLESLARQHGLPVVPSLTNEPPYDVWSTYVDPSRPTLLTSMLTSSWGTDNRRARAICITGNAHEVARTYDVVMASGNMRTASMNMQTKTEYEVLVHVPPPGISPTNPFQFR